MTLIYLSVDLPRQADGVKMDNCTQYHHGLVLNGHANSNVTDLNLRYYVYFYLVTGIHVMYIFDSTIESIDYVFWCIVDKITDYYTGLKEPVLGSVKDLRFPSSTKWHHDVIYLKLPDSRPVRLRGRLATLKTQPISKFLLSYKLC